MADTEGANGKSSNRVVIGIDPASGKGSHVFAPDVPDPIPEKAGGPGIDRVMTPSELRELLPSRCVQRELGMTPFKTDSCLVCWDAPLTGLQDPDALQIETTEENQDDEESLTTRPIERTGAKARSKYETIAAAASEKGVSIRGFSGLSHWVISRHVLGLPRVGRFDAPYEELPLYPVFDKEQLTNQDFAVTEVHPTVAVWIWLGGTKHWQQYKGNEKTGEVANAVQAMWSKLIADHLPQYRDQIKPPTDDDAFDARVAWLLGYLWLNGDSVKVIGNEQDGSFLLPRPVVHAQG
jgi:hypothetical protein